MTADILLSMFENTQDQIDAYAARVPDERAAEQPPGVRNHAAWTMTHLCASLDFVLQQLDQPMLGDPAWREVAGINTMPTTDRHAYPSMATLRSTFRRQHEQIAMAIQGKPESFFGEPGPEPFKEFFPTMGHSMTFFLASHEHQHLGQLAIWMRAAGLKQP